MKKLATGLSIFFFTLFIGIGFYFAWCKPFQSSVDEIILPPVENSTNYTTDKAAEEPTEPWIVSLSPCTEENKLKRPSSDWRGKGKVNRGVMNRWTVCGALPKYPPEAKRRNISGIVTVNVLIDEIGEVKKAQAKFGNPLLLKSAETAAYKTQFAPTMLGGTVYQASGVIMYKFDIERGVWLQDPSAPDNPFRKVK